MASLEREQIRHEHAKWSDSTFGCVGPIGPLKHLSKEALEAAAKPDDLSEWADMQFLLPHNTTSLHCGASVSAAYCPGERG
ncbi:dATP/dGTP pyrophosphohydrolase domain-containing protein [Escherichia fergusonii]|uniref:dATP/dGTP pyrophosphohydrolase domain-containing protein n=1 Tax=Escherichia fergusonii TaxID=564 RepID=UPI00210CB3C9|nr:dATP/dGTP pyrophosphohydrolase domain-containing protein [Escherichia fergusonii]